MIRSTASFLSIFALASVVACSSKTPSEPFDAGGTTGGGKVSNAYWCEDVAAPTGCNAYAACGVCVPAPSKELTRTTDTKEYKGTGSPNTSCVDKANAASIKPLGTSKKVTMKGLVKIFANGPDSRNVKVEIFLEGAGGTLGEKVGETISDEKLPGGTVSETIIKSGKEVTRILFPYEIKDTIPTEKPLIVKTSGKTPEDGWFDLYDYNVVARNDAVDAAGGAYVWNVRALGNDDYASILKAAYNRPPEGGKSALAGEVHDCDDVRMSNATVELAPKSPLGLVYLSEEEDNPLPDPARNSTGKLGLYAAGGLAPGVYRVSALGKVGSETKALGSYQVSTFPNSVTVYTFRGLRPWQIPAAK